MSPKLNKAPVFYTVTQVQFNPFLNLGEFLPSIQARMREAGFPDFQPQVIQSLIFPLGIPGGGPSPAPSVAPAVRYVFGDMEGRTNFVLETNALTLQSTSYETFEAFLAIFLAGLEIVKDSLRPSYFDRFGLRYLDAVYPMKQDDVLKQYLFPEVHGLHSKVNGSLIHSLAETVIQNANGHLVSRVIIRNGKIGFPDNFSIQPPKIDARFEQFDGLHAIIDTDAFAAQREAFKIEVIQNKAIELHQNIRESFFATVTPFALSAWA